MIQSRRNIPRRTLEGAARITVDDHQIPLVRLESRSLLGAICQFLAVRAEGRRAVRCWVVFSQALPIFRATRDRRPADIVIGAPCFMLFRHGGEQQELTIRNEREIIPAAEGIRGGKGITVSRSDLTPPAHG